MGQECFALYVCMYIFVCVYLRVPVCVCRGGGGGVLGGWLGVCTCVCACVRGSECGCMSIFKKCSLLVNKRNELIDKCVNAQLWCKSFKHLSVSDSKADAD